VHFIHIFGRRTKIGQLPPVDGYSQNQTKKVRPLFRGLFWNRGLTQSKNAGGKQAEFCQPGRPEKQRRNPSARPAKAENISFFLGLRHPGKTGWKGPDGASWRPIFGAQPENPRGNRPGKPNFLVKVHNRTFI